MKKTWDKSRFSHNIAAFCALAMCLFVLLFNWLIALGLFIVFALVLRGPKRVLLCGRCGHFLPCLARRKNSPIAAALLLMVGCGLVLFLWVMNSTPMRRAGIPAKAEAADAHAHADLREATTSLVGALKLTDMLETKGFEKTTLGNMSLPVSKADRVALRFMVGEIVVLRTIGIGEKAVIKTEKGDLDKMIKDYKPGERVYVRDVNDKEWLRIK